MFGTDGRESKVVQEVLADLKTKQNHQNTNIEVFWQVVTILKNTTKLVTDVPFPALTLCGSGLHMNNVEKKLVLDFRKWRTP